jgi:ribonuclease D
MSSSKLRPPILVETPAKLQQLVQTLGNQPGVAVDTESNSLHAYRERVCLLQFSFPNDDYLVDPIQLPSLQPLQEVFNSSGIEKVFHGAEYDLLCLWRDFRFRVQNLFDTRVAVRTLGWQKTGLGDILAKEFGARLNKRHQRANWGERPLPAELQNYARLDTHYLLELRHRLESELIQVGRLEEANEICELFTSSEPEINNEGDNGAGFWRINRANKLKPRQIAVLRELYNLREVQAQQRDCPPFRILRDEVLIELATTQPTVKSELVGITGLPQHKRERYGDRLLQAVKTGQQATIPKRKRPATDNRKVTTRFQALKRWRRRVALDRNIESDLVLPRSMLWEIARKPPKNITDLEKMMGPLTWRLEHYGPQILELLDN